MRAHKVYVGATIKHMPLGGHHNGCREPSSLDHLERIKFNQAHVLHHTSLYLHTTGQRNVSLISRRVSQHIFGNPRLGHMSKRSTQLITWVSMMQMLVQMQFWNILGSSPQKDNSRTRMSGITSKEANISQGLMRRTKRSIMRSVLWTNKRSTRSMSTIMT
jgi:DNA mismatch repair protein MutH